MENPPNRKRTGKQQVPSPPEQEANPYPLELVASIAMQMLNSQHVQVREGDSGLSLYSDTAELALAFLDECDRARLFRRARQQQRLDYILRDTRLMKEFPNGMPYLKALLHITDARSEADALSAFKQWLREEKLADWNSFPPVPASEESVAQFLERTKRGNFPIFSTDRLGTPPRFTLGW